MSNFQPTKAALTVDGACEALSIGRTLFYELVRVGRIRVVRIGRRTLIPVSEVHALLVSALADKH